MVAGLAMFALFGWMVSPIVSAYAAATVVCAVVIGGERLGAGEALAIMVVLFGVLLASSDLAQFKALERIALLGARAGRRCGHEQRRRRR